MSWPLPPAVRARGDDAAAGFGCGEQQHGRAGTGTRRLCRPFPLTRLLRFGFVWGQEPAETSGARGGDREEPPEPAGPGDADGEGQAAPRREAETERRSLRG